MKYLLIFIVCYSCLGQYNQTLPTRRKNFQPALASGSFAPTDLSGLTLWLKADNGPSTSVDGAAIATWSDKSGNAFDVTQATGASQPIYKASVLNGKPIVRFDGANDSFASASISPTNLFGTNAVTIFVVQKQLAAVDQNTPFSWVNGASRITIHASYGNTIYWDAGNTSSARISNAQPTGWDDTWWLLECYRSDTTSEVVTNGTVFFSGVVFGVLDPTLSAQPVEIGVVGGIAYFGGDIAEIILYKRALNSTERVQVRTYLNSKYTIY